MRTRVAALLGALMLLCAGCGSAGHPAASVSGHEVFTRACGFCHGLTGHDSPRQQGGDLLHNRLARPALTQYTAEMPVRHRLTRAELTAVVDYVLAVQARGR